MTADDVIEKVKDLHAPIIDHDGFFWCGECTHQDRDCEDISWPCPTIEAVTE